MKRTIPSLFATLSAAASIVALITPSHATESPEYKVVKSDGKFEIRDYPALVVAKTPMAGEGRNNGFRGLFRFISGSNEKAEKIEMTAPVLIGDGVKGKTMSFIMPGKVAEKGTPTPTNGDVTLDKIPPTRYAVFRFSGWQSDDNEKEAAAKLAAWMTDQKIAVDSQPMFAYYNPPWTLPFMRRNEVMVRVRKTEQ